MWGSIEFRYYLNSIDPHIKFTIEKPNAEGGHFLPGHLP